MIHYPLLFGRQELVKGNGFVARVAVSGRALLIEEDDGVWMEGINPGGFAASGKSPSEALAEFCRAYREILLDIASEASRFEDFREEAQRFFAETSAPALHEWEEAVQQVRAGKVDADWLKKLPAESKLGIEIVEVHQPAVMNNGSGEAALAA